MPDLLMTAELCDPEVERRTAVSAERESAPLGNVAGRWKVSGVAYSVVARVRQGKARSGKSGRSGRCIGVVIVVVVRGGGVDC